MKKYRIVLENESTLSGHRLWRGSRGGLVAMIVGVIALATALAVIVIMTTPLHTLLPGYMKEAQRDVTLESMMRIDSLTRVYNANQAYLANIIEVMNTDREPADSATMAARGAALMEADTLHEASDEEKKFMQMMEQREKYNISILAPLAADGLHFSAVKPGAIVTTESRDSTLAVVVVGRRSPVCAIADGTVTDLYYSPRERGYVIIIQHSKGFLSRYSGLANPMTYTGRHVRSGQAIGNATGSAIGLELWRNGDPLKPADYL